MLLEPLYAWARGIWDEVLPMEIMHNAWIHATHTVGSSETNDCKKVSDAAEAAANTVQRLGWGFPSACSVMRCDGMVLDLHVVCPKQLLHHAQRDLRRFEAGESSLAGKIGALPI